jgi:hypothetical protein
MQRRFCVEGITALVPDWRHPRIGSTFKELCASLDTAIAAQKINFIHI